jgi:hypothetical protein
LCSPIGSDRVPVGTLGYFQARNKRRAYSLVMKEFKKSGLSQADLARRLGKGPDVVCRLLAGPGNWTLDTVSDLLFAISGAAPAFSVEYPLSGSQRDQVGPEWLQERPARGDARSVRGTDRRRKQPAGAPAIVDATLDGCRRRAGHLGAVTD